MFNLRSDSRFAFILPLLAVLMFVSNAAAQTDTAKASFAHKDFLQTVTEKHQNNRLILITPEDAAAKLLESERDGLSAPEGVCDTAVSIAYGQAVGGSLASSDCRLSDGSYADYYAFNGTAGQQITVALGSGAFDTYLGLASDDGSFILEDDDGGGGTNSKITATLPKTGLYIILANSFDADKFGNYTLSLTLNSAPPVCTYSLNPASVNVGAAQTSGSIAVTTQPGCDLAASPDSSWITVNSAIVNSNGAGTVTYTIAANPNSTARAGTISVRGQTFTINQAAAPVTRKTRFDYDGDGKADISLFRASDRVWYINNSSNSTVSYTQFGLSTDKIVPADYDGDGRTDIAVFRPSTGNWFIVKSSGGVQYVQFGTSEDIPQPADFNGDGKADIAVFRPSTGVWFILNTETLSSTVTQFGTSEDKPVAADYNGDGKAEIAVYRPSSGLWFIFNSATGQYGSAQFGIASDKPVPADYDGDGKTDIAVYRASEGNWFLLLSTGGYTVTKFGLATDMPVAADYDGDGKTDIGVYRPSDGNWYQLRSLEGFSVNKFGTDVDKPTPNAFVY